MLLMFMWFKFFNTKIFSIRYRQFLILLISFYPVCVGKKMLIVKIINAQIHNALPVKARLLFDT